jgi:hypothetical protein
MHLRDPLLLNGSILAPAGTLATLTIVRTHHAASGDNDGSVQISLAPLALPKYGALPVRAINEYLTIDHTAGQLSTRDATDTVVDIFVPTYILWQALRKGHEYVLQPGTVFRALTAAAIDARDPQAIAIVGPQPLFTGGEAPHAAITESPFFAAQKGTPRRSNAEPVTLGRALHHAGHAAAFADGASGRNADACPGRDARVHGGDPDASLDRFALTRARTGPEWD